MVAKYKNDTNPEVLFLVTIQFDHPASPYEMLSV